MNAEKKQPASAGLLSPNRQPKAVRKKPNRKTVMALFFSMAITGALIVILGLLLLVLPLFKVKKVEVEGLKYHTYEEILAASEIQEGDEILALDSYEVIEKIYKKCPYVELCSIVKTPFSVKIIIEERKDIKSMSVGDSTVIFDRDFLVLEILENGEAVHSPFLTAKMPAYAAIEKGKRIAFADADEDYSYIARLCDALRDKGWYDSVTHADFSIRWSVGFILGGNVRIDVGSVKDMDIKLLMAEEVMKEQEKKGTDLSAVYAIIDVSDVSEKSVWTPCQSAEDLY